VAALLFMWAFFAGSETAFVSINRFRLYNLKKRGRRSAILASFLLEKPDRLLSTTLVGTNLALVLSSNLIARFYLNLFGQPRPLISLLTITIISLIFCEVLPKNFALVRNLRWTLLSSVPLFIFYIVFFPISQIFTFLTKVVIRLIGIPHTGFVQSLFKKKEDVKFFISNHLESHYTEDESRYFHDTVDFGEKRLSDVMVPLVDILAVPDTSKIRDCLEFVANHHRYSIPVYRKRIDNVVGIITAREIIDVDRNKQVSTIMQDPVFIPESKNISELYREAYEQGFSTVFAVDEYGGIVGLATMYDIGEEIVGRIDSMEAKSLITRIQNGRYLCDGDVEIDDLEHMLGLEIEHDDFTTLNGLFLQKLGKIPRKGDTLTVMGYTFTVIKGSTKKADLIGIQKEE
jgi:CBS domain containing-hemolysin-like protein